MSKWGGRREPGVDPATGKKKKLGRPPGSGKGKSTKPEPPQIPLGDDGFFDRVFARIGQAPPDKISSPEDYALDLLFSRDYQVRSVTWNRLLDHKYGRPGTKRRSAGEDKEAQTRVALYAKRLYLPDWRREVIENSGQQTTFPDPSSLGRGDKLPS